MPPTPDCSLPRSPLLRQTAAEVLREIEQYNDAYLIYLSATSLDLAGREFAGLEARHAAEKYTPP